MEILVYATFYKDYAYDYLYRINGHYQYNFSFSIVEFECAIVDTFNAILDWGINSVPFTLINMGPLVSSSGRTIQYQALNCFSVIIFQITMFMYFKNSNLQIINSIVSIMALTIVGILVLLADDGYSGLTELIQCPVLYMSLLL